MTLPMRSAKDRRPFPAHRRTQLRGFAAFSQGLARESHAPTLGLRINEVLEGIQLMKNFYADYKSNG